MGRPLPRVAALLLLVVLIPLLHLEGSVAAQEPGGLAPAAGGGGGSGGDERRGPVQQPSASGGPPPGDTSLVFVHIPKTGGTTATALIAAFMKRLNCTARVLSEGAAQGQPQPEGCSWTHLHVGPGWDDRRMLLQLSLGEAAAGAGGGGGGVGGAAAAGGRPPLKLDHLVGHVPFGYCQLLNNGRAGRCAYTTILRRPAERAISHYYYLRKEHPGLLRDACGGCDANVTEFAAALARGAAGALHLDNVQTRMIAGDGLWSSLTGGRINDNAGEVDEAMLARAKFNLARSFPVIGFTDDMSGWATDVKAFLGLGARRIRVKARYNELAGRPKLGTLPREVVDQIAATQRFDARLYAFARDLARRRKAGTALPPPVAPAAAAAGRGGGGAAGARR